MLNKLLFYDFAVFDMNQMCIPVQIIHSYVQGQVVSDAVPLCASLVCSGASVDSFQSWLHSD